MHAPQLQYVVSTHRCGCGYWWRAAPQAHPSQQADVEAECYEVLVASLDAVLSFHKKQLLPTAAQQVLVLHDFHSSAQLVAVMY